ncbi:type VI secretion system protein TssA [Stenotrophomonas humi]
MLDQNALLAPITIDAPTGEELSFSVEFDRIIESRRADDPTLDQGAWQTDIKYADWNGVLRDCTDLLLNRTKDLRLAGWLCESATQLKGFPGWASGLRITAGLCDRYWEDVHPQAQDGDQEERIGNLSWLLANSLQWLRAVPIVAAPQGRFSLADFDHAHSASTDSDSSRPGLDLLDAARRDTPHAFYRQLAHTLPDCKQALLELQAAVDNRLGLDGPSFTAARELLDQIERTSLRFARDAGLLLDSGNDVDHAVEPDAPDSFAADMPSATSSTTATTRTGPAGAPASRKEALAQLRQVAEFFRRTEPHSPVAYIAEKAARWGEMPLHVWLKHVIKDHGTLEQMEEMLGIDADTHEN